MGRLSSLISARKIPNATNGLRRFESKLRPWATQPPQSGSEGNVVVAVRRVAVWGTVERSCGLCNSKVLSHRISWEGGRRRCPRSPLAPAGPNYHACPVEYLFEPSVSSPPPTRATPISPQPLTCTLHCHSLPDKIHRPRSTPKPPHPPPAPDPPIEMLCYYLVRRNGAHGWAAARRERRRRRRRAGGGCSQR